jgi:predicted N-acetyltransferase YhbS
VAAELRALREGEREAVLDLLERAFHLRALFAAYMDFDPSYRPENFRVAARGSELLACVQIFEKTVRLRGETVRLGGIGSVGTHPAHRGQGLASALLREAIEEMSRRGMAVSLLFTGRFAFYERLGWSVIPRPLWALHAPPAPPSGAPALRPFRAGDLPEVRALYDACTRDLDGPTVRDAGYWRGQLRYAGTPEEEFVVTERGGRIAAYARAISAAGVKSAMEYARAPDAAGALAELLVALAPAGAPLVVPRAPDPALARELAARAQRLDAFEERSAMWRVLDRARLCALARLPDATPDPELLRALFGGERALYWPSDRF